MNIKLPIATADSCCLSREWKPKKFARRIFICVHGTEKINENKTESANERQDFR